MMRRLPEWRDQVLSNAAYKMVALVAAVILWLTVLGRKDTVMMRHFSLEFTAPANHVVKTVGDTSEVEFRVSGPRMALKKFSQLSDALTIDLNEKGPGVYSVPVLPSYLGTLPLGVKVLSIEPPIVRVEIEAKKTPGESSSGQVN